MLWGQQNFIAAWTAELFSGVQGLSGHQQVANDWGGGLFVMVLFCSWLNDTIPDNNAIVTYKTIFHQVIKYGINKAVIF
ncbi:MAG: hypothetical protein BZ151_10830 [Desulfobacca sp. 4484_104]|nr:MAG: hypothetical protein BZ151_10830 [Desulfobacca sp. 4484_104]